MRCARRLKRCRGTFPVLALLSFGCGQAPLAPEAQGPACQSMLAPVGDAFACRVAELTEGSHAIDVDHRYTVSLEFKPDGRLKRYSELRMLTELTDEARPAPDCVARSLRALEVEPGEQGASMALGIRYRSGVSPRAELRDGRCWLTVGPAP